MHNQKMNSTMKGKESRGFAKKEMLILLASFIAITAGIYLLNIVPRYITLPVSPPEDSYDLVGWKSTTRSTLTLTSGAGKFFIWRRDAVLSYEKADGIPSWDELVQYFDERFSKQGWVQSDSSIPCNTYLPEAAILSYGRNGYISYIRIKDKDYIDVPPQGELICLAIWNDRGYPDVFRVVLLTAKESFFTELLSIFEL